MTAHADVVRAYLSAYAAVDKEGVAACLTDDVVWEIVGHGRLEGKDAYLGEMDRAHTTGMPVITEERLLDAGDTVVATGRVTAPTPDGGSFTGAFADLFVFRGDRVCRVESYVVPLG